MDQSEPQGQSCTLSCIEWNLFRDMRMKQPMRKFVMKMTIRIGSCASILLSLSFIASPSVSLPKSRSRKIHSLLEDDSLSSYGSISHIQGPKKPRSAYIFFCQDHRDEIRNMNPGIDQITAVIF